MAIEVAPKAKIQAPFWSIAVLVIAVILGLILAGSYFYFQAKQADLEEELKFTASEKALRSEIAEKESDLALYSDKIGTFKVLLDKHMKVGNVFGLVQDICLPTVWFSTFDFQAKQNQIKVSGEADGFITIGQQVLLLKENDFFKKVSLSELSMGEEGGVSFSLLLTVDPQVYGE